MKPLLVITIVVVLGWTGCDTSTGPAETISTPLKPDGPAWLLWEDPTATYTTGGAVSSFGHPVIYQFNWGDGFNSGWGPPEQWTGWEWRNTVRKYTIRAQARCALHFNAISPLSDPLVVTIEHFESVPPETEITNCPETVLDYNTFSIKWTGSDNVTASNKLLFSFFLEGFDSGWSPFLREQQRGLSRLPDGNYTYYVKAMDEAGNEDTTAAVCQFAVAVASECDITMTRPLDGEVLPDSTLQSIEWDYAGDVYAVDIELYAAGVFVETLALSVFNDGQFEWYVSSAYADTLAGLQFKVFDWRDPACFGWSGEFSIGR